MNAVSKIAISDLTVEERLELIEALWDSLEDDLGLFPAQMEKRDRYLAMIDGPVPESHLAELERRMETFEQDKADSVPWDVFREQLANKYGF
ncbi:addiction module protein [Asticcacaulis sp. W401b]|uniref:addiction module protein n=1 Tax=Asticcacaulis sp. W401b TaxID=3388666 RepID=UPI0039708923